MAESNINEPPLFKLYTSTCINMYNIVYNLQPFFWYVWSWYPQHPSHDGLNLNQHSKPPTSQVGKHVPITQILLVNPFSFSVVAAIFAPVDNSLPDLNKNINMNYNPRLSDSPPALPINRSLSWISHVFPHWCWWKTMFLLLKSYVVWCFNPMDVYGNSSFL